MNTEQLKRNLASLRVLNDARIHAFLWGLVGDEHLGPLAGDLHAAVALVGRVIGNEKLSAELRDLICRACDDEARIQTKRCEERAPAATPGMFYQCVRDAGHRGFCRHGSMTWAGRPRRRGKR